MAAPTLSAEQQRVAVSGLTEPGRPSVPVPSRTARPVQTRGPHSAQRSHHQAGCPPSWYSSSTPSGTRASTSSCPRGGCSPAMQVSSSAPSTSWSAWPPASPPARPRPPARRRRSPRRRPPRSAPGRRRVRRAPRRRCAARRRRSARRARSPQTGALDRMRAARPAPPAEPVVGTTLAGFSESSAARSAARITFGLFGSTTTSMPGAAWMPASSSYVDGFIVGPPSTTSTPSSLNSRFTPLAARHRHDRAGRDPSPGAVPRRPAGRCARPPARACRPRRSATPRRPTRRRSTAPSGSSVCTCTLRVRSSPTTSTESPTCSSSGVKVPRVEPLARDGEVRAVAEARGLVLGTVERGGRVLVLEVWARPFPRSAARQPAMITVRP